MVFSRLFVNGSNWNININLLKRCCLDDSMAMDIRLMLGLTFTSMLLLDITIGSTTNIRSIEELDLEYNSRRFGRKIYSSCYDTDGPDQKNLLDYGCRDSIGSTNYWDGPNYGLNAYGDDCTYWDDADFIAKDLCCVCGGGSTKAESELQDPCVFDKIAVSECPTDDPTDYFDGLPECSSAHLKHNDLCYQSHLNKLLSDGTESWKEGVGTTCPGVIGLGQYTKVFKCIKECRKNHDCPRNFPFCIGGSCEECLKDDDCPKIRPYCTKTPGNFEGRCKGAYPISSSGSDCSDYGLSYLNDKTVCQKFAEDHFPKSSSPIELTNSTIDPGFYKTTPLGCSVWAWDCWSNDTLCGTDQWVVKWNTNDTSNPNGNRMVQKRQVCIAQPIDCKVGHWSRWSKKCNKGRLMRTRQIQQRALFGGSSCPKTKETKKCQKPGCWNTKSKQKCLSVKMKGMCNRPFWRFHCCKSCNKSSCVNLWRRKKCQKLKPFCRRSGLVKKKCRKACGVC